MLITVLLCIIPFLIIQPFSDKILYGLIVIPAITISFFFWTSFIPFIQNKNGTLIHICYAILLGCFQQARSTFHVQSGKFDKDYFIIQKKPGLGSLLLDKTSAVILMNRKQDKRVLLPGFHLLNPGDQVVHVIHLNVCHFYWKPPKQALPIQLTSLNLEKVSKQKHPGLENSEFSKTKSDLRLMHTFSIYYNFLENTNPILFKSSLRKLSDFFSLKNVVGELEPNLNDLIGTSITSLWQNLLMQTSLEEFSLPADQHTALYEECVKKINYFLNTDHEGKTSDFEFEKKDRNLENILFLKNLQLLNIRVFLESSSIKDHKTK